MRWCYFLTDFYNRLIFTFLIFFFYLHNPDQMSLVRKSFKKIGEISFWLIHLVGYEWWASSKKYYGKAEWEEINRVFWCIVIAITFTTTVRTKVRRTRTHIRYEDLNCLAQYLIGFCWSWQIIQMTDFECTKHTKKREKEGRDCENLFKQSFW